MGYMGLGECPGAFISDPGPWLSYVTLPLYTGAVKFGVRGPMKVALGEGA